MSRACAFDSGLPDDSTTSPKAILKNLVSIRQLPHACSPVSNHMDHLDFALTAIERTESGKVEGTGPGSSPQAS